MRTAARARSEHERNVAALHYEQATEYRNECAERLGFSDAPSYIVTLTPLNTATEESLPDERRELFRARLASVVADALSHRSNAHPDDAPQHPNIGRPASPSARAVMLNACMLCRGNCCQHGGNHAYISWNTILRYIDSTADQSADDMIASYMSYVGTTILSGGCVYQGVAGCTLPRAMRSDTCNNFLCSGLNDFLNAVGDDVSPKAFVVPFYDQAFDHGMFVTEEFVQIVRGRHVGIT